MSVIQATGVTLSMETAPGSGVFREVAELTDFQVPLRADRDSAPMDAESVGKRLQSLIGGWVHTIKVAWTTTIEGTSAFNDAINRYVEEARRWQSWYARVEAEDRRARERATRVRPLRKKIKRFK